MKQWEKEKIEQILYDKDKNFLVRSRMIDFLKTIDVDDEILKNGYIGEIDGFEIYKPGEPLFPEKVPDAVVVPEKVLESIPEASRGVFLSGNPKPQYPDYEGPPTI